MSRGEGRAGSLAQNGSGSSYLHPREVARVAGALEALADEEATRRFDLAASERPLASSQ